jgi:hypothetical protein
MMQMDYSVLLALKDAKEEKMELDRKRMEAEAAKQNNGRK